MTLFMNDLHSRWIVFAWLLHASEMEHVSIAVTLLAANLTVLQGESSETYKKCLFQVQEISRASLFSPVTKAEAVQAMSKYSLLQLHIFFINDMNNQF